MPSAISPSLVRRLFELPDFDGRGAQRAMEPLHRGPPPPSAAHSPPRTAAALAYLFPRGGGLRLPLTVRRDDLKEHRGQVSLPGGRPQAGEDLWTTALREAGEEVGLRPDAVEAVGALRPVYIPVTHTELHVWVALGPDPGPLVPQPREVARIVEVDVADLLDPSRRRVVPRRIAGREVQVPYFDVAGLFLWGATAMALSELAERLRRLASR